jgi:kynurenine formamidase
MNGNKNGLKAWYLESPEITPVVDGNFVGEVAQGSSVNFRNIEFNPHAHVTHTECMGHISEEIYSVNQHLKEHYFVAELVSIVPKSVAEDSVIEKSQLKELLGDKKPKAIIIRTMPNDASKQTANYSHTNPTYLDSGAAIWLREIGVEHLLIDTPSVDREVDEGELKAHKAFWNFPNTDRLHCTITEFVFVPNTVKDGMYLMNLQVAPFENDASPSRPILHKMIAKY